MPPQSLIAFIKKKYTQTWQINMKIAFIKPVTINGFSPPQKKKYFDQILLIFWPKFAFKFAEVEKAEKDLIAVNSQCEWFGFEEWQLIWATLAVKKVFFLISIGVRIENYLPHNVDASSISISVLIFQLFCSDLNEGRLWLHQARNILVEKNKTSRNNKKEIFFWDISKSVMQKSFQKYKLISPLLFISITNLQQLLSAFMKF